MRKLMKLLLMILLIDAIGTAIVWIALLIGFTGITAWTMEAILTILIAYQLTEKICKSKDN